MSRITVVPMATWFVVSDCVALRLPVALFYFICCGFSLAVAHFIDDVLGFW